MKKLLIGIGPGALLALDSCFAFVVIFSGPEPSVQVEAPPNASLDEPFTVRIVVTNPASRSDLDNVDIDSESLEPFLVEVISPQPEAGSPDTSLGSHTWYFGRTLQPSSQENIEFAFRPQAAGIHQLPVQICNSYQDCSRTLLSIRVESPGS